MAEEEIKNTAVVEGAEAKATESSEVEAPKTTKKSKKAKRIVNAGAVHIQATFNNTIVTVSDKSGGVLSASSLRFNDSSRR